MRPEVDSPDKSLQTCESAYFGVHLVTNSTASRQGRAYERDGSAGLLRTALSNCSPRNLVPRSRRGQLHPGRGGSVDVLPAVRGQVRDAAGAGSRDPAAALHRAACLDRRWARGDPGGRPPRRAPARWLFSADEAVLHASPRPRRTPRRSVRPTTTRSWTTRGAIERFIRRGQAGGWVKNVHPTPHGGRPGLDDRRTVESGGAGRLTSADARGRRAGTGVLLDVVDRLSSLANFGQCVRTGRCVRSAHGSDSRLCRAGRSRRACAASAGPSPPGTGRRWTRSSIRISWARPRPGCRWAWADASRGRPRHATGFLGRDRCGVRRGPRIPTRSSDFCRTIRVLATLVPRHRPGNSASWAASTTRSRLPTGGSPGCVNSPTALGGSRRWCRPPDWWRPPSSGFLHRRCGSERRLTGRPVRQGRPEAANSCDRRDPRPGSAHGPGCVAGLRCGPRWC